MTSLRASWRRLLTLLNRDRYERELRDELESHLQMHIDDNRRAGMSEADARRSALVKLGGIEQVKEEHRRRGLPVLETALKDLRFAGRLMRRSPGFTAVVLATLAIGIGANTVMFTVVNTLLLRPLPYADPERLVSVQSVNAASRLAGSTAAPDFYEYRRQNRGLASLEAFYVRPFNLTGGAEPERVTTLIVSPGFFSTLGIHPALGRGFVSQDEQWGSHRVAILTDGLWRRRHGAQPGIVGERIMVNGEPYVVAGVLPPRFSFMGLEPQLFVPMSFAPDDHMNSHSNYFLRMFGRLQPGVTRQRASADLTRISDAIIAAHAVNQGTAVDVIPLREVMVRDVRRGALVLSGAVGFVLLIACANLANLLLGRAALRQREIAVRLALGASRGRLLRQFVVESLLLSLGGGALGLGVAFLATGALNAVSLRVLPRADRISVDATVLLFTFATAVFAGILLGLAPAAHSLGPDVNNGLKEGARTASAGGSRDRLRQAFVIGEVAASLVLLVCAGLMVKSMYHLLRVDAGFDPRQVLTMQLNLPPGKYVNRALERSFSPEAYAKSVAFFSDVIAGAREVPGVLAAGAVSGLPLGGDGWGKRITLFDRPFPADLNGLSPIQYRVVAGDYFRAMGIAIAEGRAFTDADTSRSPRVAIVNKELVRHHYDGQSPLRKVISVNPPLQLVPKSLIDEARRSGTLAENYEPDRFTIVGVADDVRYGGLDVAAVPLVYVPFAQGSEGTTTMYLVVRAAADGVALAAPIRHRIARVDPDQPVASVQTMEGRLAASVAQRRMQMQVLGGFALMAALLAAIGIYGVTSYAVAQRAREIGIRLALGARRGDVIALLLRQGLTLVAAGVAVGLAGSFLITGVLQTMLFEVSPTDPAVLAAIVMLLTATALIATYVPARRAARVDPLVTLRAE